MIEKIRSFFDETVLLTMLAVGLGTWILDIRIPSTGPAGLAGNHSPLWKGAMDIQVGIAIA